MADVLFYRLDGRPLERVLPTLVERCLARGWRTVIQTAVPERRDALDAQLWTYDDASFLPHGTAGDPFAADQPVYLTAEDDNPNAATVRFLVDGAEGPDPAGYERVVHVFDGNDPAMLELSRQRWRQARDAGHAVTYWKQNAEGGWEKAG